MERIGQSAGNSETRILRGHTLSIPREVQVDLDPNWVVGFVDGEGCFHVSLQKHPEMTAGYQVLPEFVVVQHERDVQILHGLKRFFESGVVRTNHGERKAFRVRNLNGLKTVCDFFMKHPLKTKKQIDFRKFRKILLLMERKRHLTKEGLLEIIEIAQAMNSTKRSKLDEIRKSLQEG
jgi:hypothetical protein